MERIVLLGYMGELCFCYVGNFLFPYLGDKQLCSPYKNSLSCCAHFCRSILLQSWSIKYIILSNTLNFLTCLCFGPLPYLFCRWPLINKVMHVLILSHLSTSGDKHYNSCSPSYFGPQLRSQGCSQNPLFSPNWLSLFYFKLPLSSQTYHSIPVFFPQQLTLFLLLS